MKIKIAKRNKSNNTLKYICKLTNNESMYLYSDEFSDGISFDAEIKRSNVHFLDFIARKIYTKLKYCHSFNRDWLLILFDASSMKPIELTPKERERKKKSGKSKKQKKHERKSFMGIYEARSESNQVICLPSNTSENPNPNRFDINNYHTPHSKLKKMVD